MTHDHLGRRRTKDGQQFFYDGYLQIANERTFSNAVVRQSFIWDPTEPVATRPLAWFGPNAPPRLYAHDGNKNVSEVVAAASGTNATVEVVAHYDYAAFGAVIAQKGDCAEANPWRFSSEYEDTELGLDYYNYRHYEPVTGRWLSRDPIEEAGSLNLYLSCKNMTILIHDFAGLVFNKALCLALQQEIQKLVDALNHELEKYDPVLDGRGVFPYRHGNVEDVTIPGGHY